MAAMLLLTGSTFATAQVEGFAAPTPAGKGLNTPVPKGALTTNVLLRGHVLLQGRPTPPHPLWSVAVSGTLRLLSGEPAFDYVAFTDHSGYFTVTTPLAAGDYLWQVQSAQTLANAGNITLAEGLNPVEMNTLRTGDANGDNCITISDFTLLRANYGKAVRDLGYDPRTDFDENDVVDISDFSLLRGNFGQCGAGPLSTPTPTPPLPPDPAQVAPPLDPYVATDLLTASEFLYTGTAPIQTGVVAGTIELTRVAVLHGAVFTRDAQPLAGVTITVLDHPEFGQTRSRADGAFDLAVNGGGLLTLNYSKDGYLTAQRQVQAPWQDYAPAPDVVLIPLDHNVTVIDFQANSSMQVAYGSVISDTDGVRQQRPYFRPGASATRGQIAKIAALAAAITDPVPSNRQLFEDVPSSNAFWYWVEQLAGRQIISGYACGGSGEPCMPPENRPYFRWGAATTRGQLAKIAANTFFPGCQTPAWPR